MPNENITNAGGPEQNAQTLLKQPSSSGHTIEHPTQFAAGRYVILRHLGGGGQKQIYLAHDRRLERDVAIALLKTEQLDEDGLTRLLREAKAMGRLGAHPNVVTVYDIGD